MDIYKAVEVRRGGVGEMNERHARGQVGRGRLKKGRGEKVSRSWTLR